MFPYNARTKKDMLRDLAIREYPDKDAQKVLSSTFYDPQKLTFSERLKIQNQQSDLFNHDKAEPPTEAEIKAKRVYDFVNFNVPRERRTNQS